MARIARLLGDANVNILALLATAAVDGGFIGVVVDKPKKAKKAVDAAHMHYIEQPVLHVELPNTPGALARLAEKLAAKAINITAAYETSVRDANINIDGAPGLLTREKTKNDLRIPSHGIFSFWRGIQSTHRDGTTTSSHR